MEEEEEETGYDGWASLISGAQREEEEQEDGSKENKVSSMEGR